MHYTRVRLDTDVGCSACSYGSRTSTSLEIASWFVTRRIRKLEGTAIKSKPEIQFLSGDFVPPEEVEGEPDFGEICVGQDVATDRVRGIPDPMETVRNLSDHSFGGLEV